jgi:flagellar hook assembly protein FlgD
LQGNYPNPFKTDTIISYSVKDDSPVKIEIFNQKGQKVKTLINGKEKSGNHTIKWSGDDENGKAVSNGIYMYRMSSGKYSDSKKMILIK